MREQYFHSISFLIKLDLNNKERDKAIMHHLNNFAILLFSFILSALLWSPPSSRGTVKHDEEVAVLQRSRKSSSASRTSSHTDNVTANAVKSGVQLKPDYGDVEFGAGNAHLHNFRDIGSTITAMAHPTMAVNILEKSLPMPDAHSPTMTSDENVSPPSTARDHGDLYASVDISRKTSRRAAEEKIENDDASPNNVVTVATIERDGGYSSIGAHSEASQRMRKRLAMTEVTRLSNLAAWIPMATMQKCLALKTRLMRGENDFDGLYAKVKK